MITFGIGQRQIEKARLQVIHEVAKLGIPVSIYRDTFTDDGYNGKVKNGTIKLVDISGLFSKLSSPLQKVTSEGGKDYVTSAQLIVPFSDNMVQFLNHDYFTYRDETYEVVGVTNVSNLDVYVVLSLSVRPDVIQEGGE